jgi:hypothetical protein
MINPKKLIALLPILLLLISPSLTIFFNKNRLTDTLGYESNANET